jgi:hypothetical protein
MNSNGFDMFQNSGYVNTRNRKRTLILDIEDSAATDTHLGSGGEFNIQLYEPMIIDKHSEVYLDNFLTFNSNITSPDSMAFVLKINEFNMNSNVASTHKPVGASGNDSGGQNIFNSLIIPNEHKNPSNNHTAVIHKGKKFNYVCDINPQTISSLSGRITDLAGNPIFHGTHSTATQYTYALTGIVETIVQGNGSGAEDYTSIPPQTYDEITGISIVNEDNPTAATGHILINFQTDATTIHFSLAESIDVGKFHNGSGAIVFSITRPAASSDGSTTREGAAANSGTAGTITLANGDVSVNPNLQLIKGGARCISEFSIISRE